MKSWTGRGINMVVSFYIVSVVVSVLNIVVALLVIPSINGFPPYESFGGNLILSIIACAPNIILSCYFLREELDNYSLFQDLKKKNTVAVYDRMLLWISMALISFAFAILVSFCNIYDILGLSGAIIKVFKWISMVSLVFFGLPSCLFIKLLLYLKTKIEQR